jgi:hypothetical protein
VGDGDGADDEQSEAVVVVDGGPPILQKKATEEVAIFEGPCGLLATFLAIPVLAPRP